MRTDSREFNLSGLERVVSGAGSVERLSLEMERRGLERAVVVTGRTLGASGLLERITGPLGGRCVAVSTDGASARAIVLGRQAGEAARGAAGRHGHQLWRRQSDRHGEGGDLQPDCRRQRSGRGKAAGAHRDSDHALGR